MNGRRPLWRHPVVRIAALWLPWVAAGLLLPDHVDNFAAWAWFLSIVAAAMLLSAGARPFPLLVERRAQASSVRMLIVVPLRVAAGVLIGVWLLAGPLGRDTLGSFDRRVFGVLYLVVTLAWTAALGGREEPVRLQVLFGAALCAHEGPALAQLEDLLLLAGCAERTEPASDYCRHRDLLQSRCLEPSKIRAAPTFGAAGSCGQG